MRISSRWVSSVVPVGLGLALLAPAAPARADTTVITNTASDTTYTVAAGVTLLKIVAIGAGGGGGKTAVASGGPGGAGAVVTTWQPVTEGDVLTVTVGSFGVSGGNASGGTGGTGKGAGGNGYGSPSGGSRGGGGGGSTAVISVAAGVQIVAAGGGGGGGSRDTGGTAGGVGGSGASGNTIAGGDGTGGPNGTPGLGASGNGVGGAANSPSTTDGGSGVTGAGSVGACGPQTRPCGGGGGGGYGGGSGGSQNTGNGGGGGAGGSTVSTNAVGTSTFTPATSGTNAGYGAGGATDTNGTQGRVSITTVPVSTVDLTVFGDPNSVAPAIAGGQTLGSDPTHMAGYTGLTAANTAPIQVTPTCGGSPGTAREATATGTDGEYQALVWCDDASAVENVKAGVVVGGGSCLVAAGLAAGTYAVGSDQSSITGYGTNLPDGSGTPAYRALVGATPQAFSPGSPIGVYLPAARTCATAAPGALPTTTTSGVGTLTPAAVTVNGGAANLTSADGNGVTGYRQVLVTPTGTTGVGSGTRATYWRCGTTNSVAVTVDCQMGGAQGVAVTTGGTGGKWDPSACAAQTINYRYRQMTYLGYGLWSPVGTRALTGPCS
ncbi:MAG: hypothetical protein U0R64_06430 [Candidatus Nanopelagicales bacterium]